MKFTVIVEKTVYINKVMWRGEASTTQADELSSSTDVTCFATATECRKVRRYLLLRRRIYKYFTFICLCAYKNYFSIYVVRAR